MDPIILDLPKLRRKVKARFPNDKLFDIAPFTGDAQLLLEKYRNAEQEGLTTLEKWELVQQLLRLAVPDATDADLGTLAIEDWTEILTAANGATLLVEATRKNGDSDVAGAQTLSHTQP